MKAHLLCYWIAINKEASLYSIYQKSYSDCFFWFLWKWWSIVDGKCIDTFIMITYGCHFHCLYLYLEMYKLPKFNSSWVHTSQGIKKGLLLTEIWLQFSSCRGNDSQANLDIKTNNQKIQHWPPSFFFLLLRTKSFLCTAEDSSEDFYPSLISGFHLEGHSLSINHLSAPAPQKSC